MWSPIALHDRPAALIVDTDTSVLVQLRPVVEDAGYRCEACLDFRQARRRLQGDPLHAVVANLRLGVFNGIHLAYVARSISPAIRVLIYTQQHDPFLAGEVRAAGAFYRRQESLRVALTPFLAATLPAQDRRDPGCVDRRRVFRGGRRSTDVPLQDRASGP